MKYTNKIDSIQKRKELKQNMQKMLSLVHTVMHSKLTDQTSSLDEKRTKKRQKVNVHRQKNTSSSVNFHSFGI